MSLWRRVAAMALVLAALVGRVSAQGEVSLQMFAGGVKAGVSVGDFRFTAANYTIYKHHLTVNAVAGAWLQLRTKSGFSIRPEAAFTGRGANLEWEDVKYRLRANCLDIRLGLIYNFKFKKTMLSPYIVAAPIWNMTMDGRVDYTDYYTGDIVMPLSASSMRIHDFGMFCGVGFEYPVHGYGWAVCLSGEVGYNWGLGNDFSRKEQTTDVTVLNPSLDQLPALGNRFARGVEVTFRVGVPFGKVIEWRKQETDNNFLFEDDEDEEEMMDEDDEDLDEEPAKKKKKSKTVKAEQTEEKPVVTKPAEEEEETEKSEGEEQPKENEETQEEQQKNMQ